MPLLACDCGPSRTLNLRSAPLQARAKLAAAKVLAPNAVLEVIDQAIQVHGGGGVSDDFPLARMWAQARTLRLADGPDDVHLLSIAKLELASSKVPTSRL